MPRRKDMRILLILTDGYGCPGGIGRVNLDLIDTLCADASVSKVVALGAEDAGKAWADAGQARL